MIDENKKEMKEKLRRINKEYFLTEQKEEKDFLLSKFKKRKKFSLIIIFIMDLLFAGVIFGIFGWLKSDPSYDMSNIKVPFIFLCVALVAVVAWSLFNLVRFIGKTKTADGLIDTFIDFRVKVLPKKINEDLLDLYEKYERKNISAEEYNKQRNDIMQSVILVIKK